jgi:hypothetical protein
MHLQLTPLVRKCPLCFYERTDAIEECPTCAFNDLIEAEALKAGDAARPAACRRSLGQEALAELRQLEAAATPGPWPEALSGPPCQVGWCATGPTTNTASEAADIRQAKSDAALIAAMRNAFVPLLHALEALRVKARDSSAIMREAIASGTVRIHDVVVHPEIVARLRRLEDLHEVESPHDEE